MSRRIKHVDTPAAAIDHVEASVSE
jgi:hypothetical protein